VRKKIEKERHIKTKAIKIEESDSMKKYGKLSNGTK
jgi:hypothetical protein